MSRSLRAHHGWVPGRGHGVRLTSARALLVGVLVLGMALLAACSTDGPDPTDTRSVEAIAAADNLLRARANAALTKDRGAWDATIMTVDHTGGRIGVTGGEQRLRDEFAVFGALPWQTLKYEKPRPGTVPVAATRGAAPEFTVLVTVVSQLRDVESSEQRATETFTVRQASEGWRLTGHPTTADLARPWLLPGARVVVGASSVVVGTVDQASLERYAADTDSAVAKIARLWPVDTAMRPLVVVPASATDLAALGPATTTGSSHEIAAFTDGPMGADGRATADRVVLDPEAMSRLTPEGRTFVVTHEIVHVAGRSRLAGQAPLWLQEGFADWVGYEGSGLVPAVIAADALAEDGRHGVPTELPSAESFAAAGPAIQAEYQRSWVLVALLVDRHGLPAVLDLVRASTVRGSAADAEQAADRAMVNLLGTTRSDVTAAWQRRLVELAGKPPATG